MPPGKHYLNAMMVAYLPADDPQIAIGISIEYGGYGARTGDLVVDIANAYFALKDGSLAQQAEAEKEAEQAQQEDQAADRLTAAQAAAGQTADTAAAAGLRRRLPQRRHRCAGNGQPKSTAQPAVQDGPQRRRRRRAEPRCHCAGELKTGDKTDTGKGTAAVVLNGNIPEKKTKLNVLYKKLVVKDWIL